MINKNVEDQLSIIGVAIELLRSVPGGYETATTLKLKDLAGTQLINLLSPPQSARLGGASEQENFRDPVAPIPES